MLHSCMNWTTATSIRTRGLREHPESTDLSRSCREASELPGKDSSRESVRLFSCPSTPLNPFFSANAHCLRADRRDARVHCRKQKCAYSAQFWCNLSPLDATLLSLLLCVANKELAQYLSPVDATLTKNRGVGVPSLLPCLTSSSIVTRHAPSPLCPEEPNWA